MVRGVTSSTRQASRAMARCSGRRASPGSAKAVCSRGAVQAAAMACTACGSGVRMS